MTNLGTHCILELYDCPKDLLNDESRIRQALSEATTRGLATLIKHVSHAFEPQGVTVLGLLAESHISIHTWPEVCYAAADVFTCGDRADPHRACHFLVKALQAGRYELRTLKRGRAVRPDPVVV